MQNLTQTFIQDEQLLISEQPNGEAVDRLAANQMESIAGKPDTTRSAGSKRQEMTSRARVARRNRWTSSRGGSAYSRCQNGPARLIVLIGLLVPLLLTPAEAWRFFDSANPETRLYNTMQPLHLLAAPSPPINLPTQHLKPVSSMNQVSDIVASTVAQMVADQPQPLSAQSAPSATSSVIQSGSSRSSSDQAGPKEAPKLAAPADTAGSSARDSSLLGDLLDKQAEAQSPAKARQPKPAGKIMDSPTATVSEATPVQPKPESSQSVAEKATQQVAAMANQLLKPRKAGSEGPKQSSSSVEQQIINQHAKLYLTPQQRIGNSLATKHRGSVGDKMAASFDSSGGRDSSALSSIFSNFRTQMTSRASIVKAISDNKLARSKC